MVRISGLRVIIWGVSEGNCVEEYVMGDEVIRSGITSSPNKGVPGSTTQTLADWCNIRERESRLATEKA